MKAAAALLLCALLQEAKPEARTFVVRFDREAGKASPRTGFLGGLRDEIPDAVIRPLQPSLWRIGHQFRGRVSGGLTAAIDRVEKLGAKYKLVMSDLIASNHEDWPRYEADVRKLVAQAGERSPRIIWEPVNEPDISHKPIDRYYRLYARAFKALREADPKAEICGPGFAFPSHAKYREFLEGCRQNRLECNYLAWHYTGWDPDAPERSRWDLGRLPGFIREFPEQKIREVHCDEWGAGPDKPGRLHPGRAIVWFHYLENVYRVDRACRANWGKEDDHLGGIVAPGGATLPVYHAYRFYASWKGRTRAAVEGSDRSMACLAARDGDLFEVLLGSLAKGACRVTLDLRGPLPPDCPVEVRMIPGRDLDAPLEAGAIPLAGEAAVERRDGAVRVVLGKVEENQVYRVTAGPRKP